MKWIVSFIVAIILSGTPVFAQTRAQLNWSASTDNVGVTGYNIYRNGVKVGTSNTTSFVDTGLTPSTSYNYTVKAFDAAGNESGASNQVTVTTLAQSACGAPANTPGGADPFGGCFPGPNNTGPNAPQSSMAAYTGPCTVTTPNTVIDSKVVNCSPLVVDPGASGLMIKNSYIMGGVIQNSGSASFTIQDSLLNNAIQYPACSPGGPSCPAGLYACGDPNNQTTQCGVGYQNFTILRTQIINSNRAAYCESNCTIQDNYFHGTNLWPNVNDGAHASSLRVEQFSTITHNTLACDFMGPFPPGDILGCSADISGYPDFAPIKNNTITNNLFITNIIGVGFCVYGGGTAGKPFSNDPTNATNIKFQNNVFQKGANGLCGTYGPVADFKSGRTGNVWSGNVWDDGTPVLPDG